MTDDDRTRCLECGHFVKAERHGSLVVVFCALPRCTYCELGENTDHCTIHSDTLMLQEGENEQ